MKREEKRVKEKTEALKEDSKARVMIEFADFDGNLVSEKLDATLNLTTTALNEVLGRVLGETDETYTFFFEGYEIQENLKELLVQFPEKKIKNELHLRLQYLPETPFRVKPVTRISSSLDGHTQPVLDITFSPNNKYLASASGDKTIRLWDVLTETGSFKLEGHEAWVLALSWSPDSSLLTSGDEVGTVIVWRVAELLGSSKNRKDPEASARHRTIFPGHKSFVTSISWRPFNVSGEVDRFVSSSKDATLRFWSRKTGKCLKVGARHSKSVTRVVWGGEDFVYSCSQDTTVILWTAEGEFVSEFRGHAHWVNCLALNTYHLLRAGYFEFADLQAAKPLDDEPVESRHLKAKKIFNAFLAKVGPEVFVTASDDHTLMLFDRTKGAKCVRQYPGHTAPVNQVQFAPNGVLFVSASFDKTLKLWSSKSAGCLATLRGHLSQVYTLAFSKDSRWFVSGSKDSTIQVWSVKDRKRAYQLPGHADEVFAVDWAPDGVRLASGGKDKMVRIWRN